MNLTKLLFALGEFPVTSINSNKYLTLIAGIDGAKARYVVSDGLDFEVIETSAATMGAILTLFVFGDSESKSLYRLIQQKDLPKSLCLQPLPISWERA